MKRAWMLAPALFAAGPLGAAEPSPFDGIQGLLFEYYDVEGRTPREIYRSMMARSPNNGQHWGLTKSQSRDRWRTLAEGSSCRVVDVQTTLSITVLLPRHVQPDEMTDEGWAMWRTISGRIRAHEARHARIAWDHRNDFRKAASGKSCASIKRIPAEVGDNVRALQRAFDEETDYGRKGAPKLIL